MNITLICHIVFSVLSIIGAYMSGISIFRSCARGLGPQMSAAAVKRGRWITSFGVVIVTLTGFILLFQDMAKFFSRGYFIANLTVIVVILIIEASFLRSQVQKNILINRTLSMFSWTWVFIVATSELPFSYPYFIITYALLASVVTSVLVKKYNLPCIS